MSRIKQIIDLRTSGWTYAKIAKKVGLSHRRVMVLYWESHMTEKELEKYKEKIRELSRERYKIIREIADKKGLLRKDMSWKK